MDKSVVDNAIAFARRKFTIKALKVEQDKAICAFLAGKDIFVSLPTGYGKSLCFAMLPLMCNYWQRQRDLSWRV